MLPLYRAFRSEGDQYIGLKVPQPHPEGKMKEATVKCQKQNHDGTLLGKANENPLLDIRVYEVEHTDGNYSEYYANVIAENLYAHIDDNGNSHCLISAIAVDIQSHTFLHLNFWSTFL